MPACRSRTGSTPASCTRVVGAARLGEVIFGSSNWTIASANQQDEHNYFYAPYPREALVLPVVRRSVREQVERHRQLCPVPAAAPGPPTYASPENVHLATPPARRSTWEGGTWAHLYDIYLGTTPNAAADRREQTTRQPGSRDRKRAWRSPTFCPARPTTGASSAKHGHTWKTAGRCGVSRPLVHRRRLVVVVVDRRQRRTGTRRRASRVPFK